MLMDLNLGFRGLFLQDIFSFAGILDQDILTSPVYFLNSLGKDQVGRFVIGNSSDKESFVRIMDKNDIQAKEKINFVDEFPRVTRPLTQLDRQAARTR
jgi:hypothetical protein